MATLDIEGDDVVVRLSMLERAESANGDVRVARSSITSIEVVRDPARAAGGHKVIGVSFPGASAIGTFRVGGRHVFAVVHHGAGEGVRLTLDVERFDEVVIGCENPHEVVAPLRPTGHRDATGIELTAR
jgi:hypothetical protein